MKAPLITALVQTPTRHHLNLENDEGGMASVEVMNDAESITIIATLDDDLYPVNVTVRMS